MNRVEKRLTARTQCQPRTALGAALKRFAAGLALAGLALGASAFEAPADGVYADRIDWGVTMDLSGPSSYAQIPWTAGMKAYMRMINEAGGIHGRKINVLAEDDRYDLAQFKVNYEKFVSQTPVLGISGFGHSNGQATMMQAVRRNKVPIVGTHVTTKPAIDPPNPMFYGGFCGFREMAQVGVSYFAERLKLKTPKVAVVHLDVASGVEYFGTVESVATRLGGSAKSLPIKVNAIDANSQVREIIELKPDFITVHGVSNTAILLMRTMAQFGLKIPTFAITYMGTPNVYAAMGPEVGSNYYFVSCFTPGGVDDSPGVKQLMSYAEKYGNSGLTDDLNYVAGWVVGQIVAEAVAKAGPEPTREKLVESMNKGFEVDTKGLSAPIKYTRDDHLGLTVLRPYSYDFQAKRFRAYGNYSDYQKYVK